MSFPDTGDWVTLGYSSGVQNKPTNKIRTCIFRTDLAVNGPPNAPLTPAQVAALIQEGNAINASVGDCIKASTRISPITGKQEVTRVVLAWASQWVNSRSTVVTGSTGGS